MAVTDIEWTKRPGTIGETTNPTTGCDQLSEGCVNCYAMLLARRLKGMGAEKYQNDGDPRTSGPGFGITMHPSTLTIPLKWKAPRTVFVNSMSDLFHAGVTDEFIAQVFAVAARTPRHTYIILTKRHARMRSLLRSDRFREQVAAAAAAMAPTGEIHGDNLQWPLPNVWLGVSVENQQWADIRIPALLDTPAAVRMLSCEPLLGPVDLSKWLGIERYDSFGWGEELGAALTGRVGGGIGWVITGGESGRKARPMHPAWARSLRDQCQAAGVPFFFKQWGRWAPAPWKVPVCDPEVGWRGTDAEMAEAKAHAEAVGATHSYAVWAHNFDWGLYRPSHKPWSLERTSLDEDTHAPMREHTSKKGAGRLLDGREWLEFPEEVKASVSA